MDLPIDTAHLNIVIGEPCAPRTDRETGQQRTDKMTGRPIFDTGLIVGDGSSATPVRVKTFAKMDGAQMAPVTVTGLSLTMLVMSNGDKVQYFTAEAITPAQGGGGDWGPAPAGGAAKSAAATSASSASSATSGGSAGSGSVAGKAGA